MKFEHFMKLIDPYVVDQDAWLVGTNYHYNFVFYEFQDFKAAVFQSHNNLYIHVFEHPGIKNIVSVKTKTSRVFGPAAIIDDQEIISLILLGVQGTTF